MARKWFVLETAEFVSPCGHSMHATDAREACLLWALRAKFSFSVSVTIL